MDDHVHERPGVTRVKELEQIVKKLEQENKHLLDKVRADSPTLHHKRLATELQEIQDDPLTSRSLDDIEITGNGWDEADSGGGEELENGEQLVDLELQEGLEDEWLYVSPKLPPTPAQKKLTPVRWLLDGLAQGGGREEERALPSIDDIRKTLTYNISEAENLTSYGAPSGAYSPGSTSPTLRSRSPTNKTAQKYLDQVRQRRLSPPPSHHHEAPPPSTSSPLTRRTRARTDPSDDDSVPVVRWRARQPPPPSLSDEDPEEEVPRVKRWNIKQVPSGGGGGGVGAVPIVRWDPSMATGSEEEEVEKEGEVEAVPVVKWKARLPPSGSGNGSSPRSTRLARPVPRVPPSNQDDVPVVKWKARLPPEPSEDVPVVKRPSKPPSHDQDVPVVKWKARLPPDESNEDVPVIKRPSKPAVKNTPPSHDQDVPVVKWKARLPPDEGNNEDVPVIRRPVQHHSPSSGQERRGLVSPRRRGLAPPTVNGGDSDHSSGSELDQQHSSDTTTRVSRYTAHQSGVQKTQSGHTTKSPSGLRYGGSGLTRPARIVSPNCTAQSGGSNSSQEDIRSSVSPSTSAAGSSRLKLPARKHDDDHSPTRSTEHEPRRLSAGLHQSSSTGRAAAGRPPRAPQGRTSLGGSRSSPSQIQSPRDSHSAGGRRLTPPSGSSGHSRRVLPTPPSSSASPLGASRGRGGTRGVTARTTPQRHPQPSEPQDNDNWLEGCF